MFNLAPRFAATASTQDLIARRVPGHYRAPARIERAVRDSVAVEHGRSLVEGARVRALEYVSTEALQAVGGLTELEAHYIRRCPLGEARYRAIVDTAAMALAQIVAETGRS
ncbi:hypothetical protein GCM10023321_37700 [Pseudonocardia eucalypti]|uniref:Uncharacterized protein n=1 Tax=Pseudonocardia eucalypti TaxID=648755 RepID=A0ABP9Q7R4_9PSEU|nr:hypothetical protein [Pseudonocardia eucalypti]